MKLFSKKFRWVYVCLLLILSIIVIGYLIYYYLYPELMFEAVLKGIFGSENLTLDCWGYQFISDQTSQYTNQSLTTRQKVNFLRDSLNRNYLDYVNFTESSNITKPEYYVLNLTSQSAHTNLVESIYALLEDTIPDTAPKTCNNIRSEEELSKSLLTSVIMVYSALSSYEFSGISSDIIRDCENVTNRKECAVNSLYLLGTIAEEKKNSLPVYREIKLNRCPSTLVYLQIKDLEKKIRSQLPKSEDPFSIMSKSLQIDIYDKCSQQLHDDFMSNHTCPIIPPNRVDSIDVIIYAPAHFSICCNNYLRDGLTTLREQLNVSLQ